jgi:DNA-binding MarR family transcriptional regulator
VSKLEPLTMLLLRAAEDKATTLLTVRDLALLVMMTNEQRKGRDEPWGTGELARALKVQKPTITRAMTTMARHGLIRSEARRPREGRKGDLRLRDIEITSKGLAVVDHLLAETAAGTELTLVA